MTCNVNSTNDFSHKSENPLKYESIHGIINENCINAQEDIMKKVLLAVMIFATLFSLFGCSGTKEEFHYDYINKYSIEKKGEYYIETIGDVLLEDFGMKYNAELYDVEPTNDDELCYYYKYEGADGRTKAFNDMKAYNIYLNENPGLEHEEKMKAADLWYYKIIGTDMYVKIIYFDMSDSGMLVTIVVPTKGIIGEQKDGKVNIYINSDKAESGSGN